MLWPLLLQSNNIFGIRALQQNDLMGNTKLIKGPDIPQSHLPLRCPKGLHLASVDQVRYAFSMHLSKRHYVAICQPKS